MRIDQYIAEKENITRSKAQGLIRGGSVLCNGRTVTKTGYSVEEGDTVEIINTDLLRYVSRGGLKLEKAIHSFALDFTGKRILDIGSSTGGFTDCALQHGASSVISVDVGTDVMDHTLRNDPRIELHEGTDIRDFPKDRFRQIDYVVCDVSFISLLTVMRPLQDAEGNYELILLIKPQFECGPETARRYRGVITDRNIHREVLRKVVRGMAEMRFSLREITYSPISGGDGNIEYITRFIRNSAELFAEDKLDQVIDEAFRSVRKNR